MEEQTMKNNLHFLRKRRIPRRHDVPATWRDLEYLESRLLMAADASTGAMLHLPGTETIKVEQVVKIEVNTDGTSKNVKSGDDWWAARKPLKFKGHNVSKSNKADIKRNGQKFARPLGDNAKTRLWGSDLRFKTDHASADLDNLFAAIANSTDSHRDWLGDWASRHIAFSAELGREMAKQTAVAVLDGFGERSRPTAVRSSHSRPTTPLLS